jgi:hypothetical protein
MRAFALLAAVLALVLVSGCGGGDEIAPQTPGEPASMPIPESAEPPGGSGGGDSSADQPTDDPATPEDESATPEATAPTDDSTTTEPPPDQTGAAETPPEAAPAPEDTGGGTTAPSTEADGPTNDTAPPAGSDAEQFEDFCAQNPGAC